MLKLSYFANILDKTTLKIRQNKIYKKKINKTNKNHKTKFSSVNPLKKKF